MYHGNLKLSNFNKDDDSEMVEKMANYAVKIAYYNFEWRYITLVICTTVHAIGVETFMKNYDKSVVLKMGEYVPKRTDIQQYVLFGEETPDIIRLLDFIAKMHYNNAGKFIILCVSLEDGDCNEYEVLKLCMNYLHLIEGHNHKMFFVPFLLKK